MIFTNTHSKQDILRKAMTTAYRQDETSCVNALIPQATLDSDALKRIHDTAYQLVVNTRLNRQKLGGLDNFLNQYDLSSQEGIALMCLAESLLRIPDTKTIDKLISDKLSSADWSKHLTQNTTLFTNAATWSLMLTGKLYAPTLNEEKTLGATLTRFMSRTSAAVLRPIILQAMKILGKQFVMGQTIEEALTRAKTLEATGYRYSYDMLGESARTLADAGKYFKSYEAAIAGIGKISTTLDPIKGPGISVKLSALHPRYEYTQRERILKELSPQVLKLAQQAKAQNIGLTIDAEEADRLDLSLDLFEIVFSDPSLNGWEGLGLAVQSYQKRAPYVIDWLIQLSMQHQRRIMVRLIKGAYWDAEIKQSQLFGFAEYPVFTRKQATDVSFIACAKKLLAHTKYIYSQFGTHNAYSVAAVLEMAGTQKDFEFQCLHGMGQPLYDNIVSLGIPCRIYAPVGSHKDLLGYLVRRLLENGANTSFINRLADESTPVEQLIADPVARIAALDNKPHPKIPLPTAIYSDRKNALGLDLSNRETILTLKQAMEQAAQKKWTAGPLIAGKMITRTPATSIQSPSETSRVVGTVTEATAADTEAAIAKASAAASLWAKTPVAERANCLGRAADLFEAASASLMALLCLEGGKQLADCLSEVRETVDYCRYYAVQARKDLSPQTLLGPTGETNQLTLYPRGVIACISPWNFPLAIFTGQIVAALVTGNCVIAKPAEQTPLIAAEAIRLLHQAGIPEAVLHLLPGSGEVIGNQIVADPRIAGVMFTGSTETAKLIQQSLTNRPGPMVPLIAETGGQNTMIVDSSALAEQVVIDVIQSAFNSAGQRCSALRVLFLQTDIAPTVIEMLKGAMAELKVGDPSLLETDIGPVIDTDSANLLQKHVAKMTQDAKLLYQVPHLPETPGHYFAPCVFELTDLSLLQREVFGPILHIIPYQASELDQVLDSIIATGYGLTLGIHSRINATVDYIISRMPVGNIYVNRNIIGAVVGVQPFGGEKLSGTGPKAGGPHYLPHLCVERTVSVNITASGGNTALVSLSEDES